MLFIKKDSSIKEKFIKVMSLVSFIMVLVVSILSYNGSKQKLEQSVEKNLNQLSESIYQSMTNSMLAGKPKDVINAEESAQKIKGVKHLNVYKSEEVIKLFNTNDTFTNDPRILSVFRDKKKLFEEANPNGDHQMVILKPFIAQSRCIQCHVSSKEGDVLGVMDLRVSLKESDKDISSFTTMVVLSNILMATIMMMLVWYLLNKFISNPLKNINTFVKSLVSKERDLTKRVPILSQDDLGKLSTEFNNYLQTIEDNAKKEKIFISEAQKSIELVKEGWYKDKITTTAPGNTLNEFKDSVNDMIEATNRNFEKLNEVLQQYQNHNYTNTLQIKNLKSGGAFDVLVKHINDLRDVITQMLIHNKENGLRLNKTSDTLLENMKIINQASITTKSSLKDVNNELKNITENISYNRQNVSHMSKINKDVIDSSKIGEKLANKTYAAMSEINTQVTSINEAIEVIDQIAFQTNILSLNAAVEAATAGEAGKGFAVVASEVRNLASKSAEAATRIKELVENATKKTDEGKDIAHDMIDGYKGLNSKIHYLVEYFEHIKKASNEQLSAIDKINISIHNVTNQIKSNADVTNKTKEIALETDLMAKHVVKKVNEKEFVGKESIEA